jgi:hypothetical protein
MIKLIEKPMKTFITTSSHYSTTSPKHFSVFERKLKNLLGLKLPHPSRVYPKRDVKTSLKVSSRSSDRAGIVLKERFF